MKRARGAQRATGKLRILLQKHAKKIFELLIFPFCALRAMGVISCSAPVAAKRVLNR
jgi:hypothetical protein